MIEEDADRVNAEIEESKYEMFQIALGDGDYNTCRAVITDTKELGLDHLAAQMLSDLMAAPITGFKTYDYGI